nr:helicase-related protein [Asticcacaulis machinosus]
MGHATGMIGLPLRLLAREVYDRVVKEKGVHAVALITGEEKIIPKLPSWFICTVEAMPLERKVDFLAVDEIQLCGDTERGHVFTDRLLNARGRYETLFMGAKTVAPLFRNLFPNGEIMFRERLSQLSYTGPRKLTRLPKRTAIVAFSTEKVYAIAELIRRQRGGAAVVMGSLSPKTRNAQVELFQSGQVDFLVATDAIGMGLNMDIDHVAFSGLTKFDGKRTRHLFAQEAGQIAGRAGRFTNTGTFGVTGDCDDMDEDLVAAIENHRFDSLMAAQWRNRELEFASIEALLRSLTRPTPSAALMLAKEALDEKALRHLVQIDDIADKVRNPVSLRTLWDVCQLPDFRKVSLDEHLKTVEFLFWSRMRPDGFVPEDWFEEQLGYLDRLDGDIDTLAGRLAGVRTLSYIANRPNWLKQIELWRDRTRDLEERLSDKLHEGLMKRFVDARTSALLKVLNTDDDLKPEVSPDGEVRLEGQLVGTLRGLEFTVTSGESLIEDKTLRQAAHRAIRPLINERLKALAHAKSGELRLKDSGVITWKNQPVARLEASDWFSPRISLLQSFDQAHLVEIATRRLSDYVRQTTFKELKALKGVLDASKDEAVTAPVRAIAYQLYENGGVLLRNSDTKLSPEDKTTLRTLHIAANRFVYSLPDLNKPNARRLLQAFGKVAAKGDHPARALSLKGQIDLPGYGVVVLKVLDAADKAMDKAVWIKGAAYVRDQDMTAIPGNARQGDKLMAALGYAKTDTRDVAEGDARTGWRPKKSADSRKPKRPEPEYINPYSPFAVLRQK